MMPYDRDQNTGFLVDTGEGVVEVATDQLGTCRLEVIDEAGQLEVRRQRQQTVDVVGFAVELAQLATPIPAPLFCDFAKTLKHRRCDALAAYLVTKTK
jgi:hypothetical protein